MKSILLLTITLTLAGIAQAIPHHHHSRVLVEKTTAVGFAPPETRGIYKFQVLSSGVVQRIDNKNRIESLATLAPTFINQIESAITAIDINAELVTDETLPRCADAPSKITTIYKSDDSMVVIKKRIDCIDSNSTSPAGYSLAQWLDNLDAGLSPLTFSTGPAHANLSTAVTPPLIDERPTKIIECHQEPIIADDGFALYLSPTDFDDKTFNLTIERSLLIGTRTETYMVVNKTKQQPVGAPALYEGSTIKLTIQGTTTPRPDNKKVGHFTRSFGSHQIESRELLCTYN